MLETLESLKKQDYFDVASITATELTEKFDLTLDGYTNKKADEIKEEFGDNEIDYGDEKSFWKIVAEAYLSPFSLILIALSAISFVTEYVLAPSGQEDLMSALIILILVILSGTIEFIQTVRSNRAAEQLETLVEVTSQVKRDGEFNEIPTEEIVLGDIVRLSAGDMIPADMRLTQTKDLFISQTSLTGESYPVEKRAHAEILEKDADTSYETLAFTGSEVVSGSAEGIVVKTGNDTLFGDIAKELAREPIKTSFDQGIENTSKLLIRFMLIMAPTVIIINGLTIGDWLQALLFGISVAVGLTPEMLPMIVSTNLVKGANDMAAEGTIVRDLNAIQNFGAIDILCTDKTGTLTQDKIVLQYHLGIDGEPNTRVLKHGYLNSYYQTGLKNLMDVAIIEAAEEELDLSRVQYDKVDEIPFDFNRRRMSIVVADPSGKTQMITKGAIEEMLSISNYVDLGERGVQELTEDEKAAVLETVDELNSRGLRVLGVSQKTNPSTVNEFSVKDEDDMVLMGYLAFLDPPKETTEEALAALKEHNVDLKILTGDNALVTQSVAKQVGLDADDYISGEELSTKEPEELYDLVEKHNLFVKLNPTQKADLVRVLRENGHVVGFMGDGINDSPAMNAADVGISVDNAVDIAKESADIILLEKDLMVLEQGIVKGREIFGNIMKYIKATTSSNFGNIFSVLIASIFLPFLPMLPVQLLFLNLLYDVSCMSIPWDNMDEEYLEEPKKWGTSSIQKFIYWFGPTSSIFDIITFGVLFFIILPNALGSNFSGLSPELQETFIAMFHSGWFIVSLWTQTLVLHALRTPKVPFLQSYPSFIMTTITTLGIIIGTLIPFVGFGSALGFAAVPSDFWYLLLFVVIAYLLLTTVVKNMYVKRYGELL